MSAANDLPKFKYHQDPLATGSIVPSTNACQCCGLARGFIYNGSPHSVEELENAICPWCIANGMAHKKFGAEFTDLGQVGGAEWMTVSPQIAEEVAFRTRGFAGWQQERWFTQCGDAGEFLGPMGRAELELMGSEAIAVIRSESGYFRRTMAGILPKYSQRSWSGNGLSLPLPALRKARWLFRLPLTVCL